MRIHHQDPGISVPVRVFVNALPPDLPPERAAELLQEYRQERDCPAPNSPPRWYVDQLIAALEAVVQEVQAA